MPPPVPASLLKAVTFPCRHCPFPPPKNTDHVLRFSCGAHRTTRILHYFSSYCHSPDKSTGLISADRAPRLGSLRMMASGGSGGAGSRRSVGGGGDGIRAHVGGSSSAVHQDGVGQMNGGFKGEEEERQQRRPRLMTLPTVLTLGRVAAVPLLVSTFYMNDWWATTATTSIFLAAAVTDWLDGYLARRMQLGTAFGAFLDPVADKLMVAATLVLLCTSPLEVAVVGEVPWLLAIPSIAIIGREITMSAVREWAASQNSKVLEAVAVNNLGKWKTATQMTALAILLASRDPSLTGQGVLVASGVVLLYVSAGLAVLSLIVYMRNIWRILLK